MSGIIAACPGGLHSFQMDEVKVPNGSGGESAKKMMYCTKCGDAYLFGKDGGWHHVQVGDEWPQHVTASSGKP